jgi:hypothetical protein
MKKWTIMLAATTVLVACDNNKNDAAKESLDELGDYVDSVKGTNRDYEREAYWADIEKGYEERKAVVEANKKDLSEKQMEEYGKIEAEYMEMKTAYQTEWEKVKGQATDTLANRKANLRGALLGEPARDAAFTYAFMTEANALTIFKNFVNTVEANKDAYSKEDWEHIRELYKGLEQRREEIESKISADDKRQILALKARYMVIKAVNKPFSETELEQKEGKDKK